MFFLGKMLFPKTCYEKLEKLQKIHIFALEKLQQLCLTERLIAK